MYKKAVVCDGCNAVQVFNANRGIEEARAVELCVKGWTLGSSGRLTLDFCPTCSEARANGSGKKRKRGRPAEVQTAVEFPPAVLKLEVIKVFPPPPNIPFTEGKLSDMVGEHEEEAR